MDKVTSGKRLRTCRACGKQFDYPVKGSDATRHHCEDCVHLPAHLRLVAERLAARISTLERQLKRLQPPAAPAPPPASKPSPAQPG